MKKGNASSQTRNRGKSKKVGAIQRNFSGWMLLLPSLFLFVFLVWRPIIVGIIYSFFDLKGFTPTEFVGFKNYIDVITDTNFIQTLWNTVQYVLWSLIIGYIVPFACAFAINEVVHFKRFFKISVYLPVIIPSIAMALIWRMVYMENAGGLLNMVLQVFGAEPRTWLSNKSLVIPLLVTAMTWKNFGGTMIVYLSSMQSVDQTLYEAARLDGAGIIARIVHIFLPHMKGIMLLMLINQIIAVFNIMEQPMTMTGGGPNGASMSLALTNYNYAFKYNQFDKSLALGVITFLLLFVLAFVYFYADRKVNED